MEASSSVEESKSSNNNQSKSIKSQVDVKRDYYLKKQQSIL